MMIITPIGNVGKLISTSSMSEKVLLDDDGLILLDDDGNILEED